MKYLLLILFLFTGISNACVVGPYKVTPTNDLGFTFKKELSESCENCSMISISVPEIYKTKPVSHSIFSAFQNSVLVSKTVIPFEKDFNDNSFIGFISNERTFTYEIQIEYGHHKCMSYQFNYSGSANGS